MLYPDPSIRCNGCGVEIIWAPVVVDGRHYCCEDCRQNRVCACGERIEEDERRGVKSIAGEMA